jgi:malonyl-CoA decarboxylase
MADARTTLESGRTSVGGRPSRLLARLLRPFQNATFARRGVDDVVDLCHQLLSVRGEASGARLATEALSAYAALDAPGLDDFFNRLVREFSPDPSRIDRTAAAYRTDPTQLNLVRLQHAVEAPRQELFRRLNMATGGTAALVAMRAHLLKTLAGHPERAGLAADLTHLFRSWFNRGFLELRRIDWHTSALILERLIDHEAVHEIKGWADLRRRLAADRRCYAFFHPALPDEPLIFIEIALTRGMAARIQPLLDPRAPVADPTRADCAIFYSITSCLDGLRSISFGDFLIKQVADDLIREFRRLKTLATLSPIPTFTRWLKSGADPAVQAQLSADIVALVERCERGEAVNLAEASREVRDTVCALGAYYLLQAKKAEEPPDPVERFHLANGARLERLNWMGDTSSVGLKRGLGLMVNYAYRLGEVERNHEGYAMHRVIAASPQLHKLASLATRSPKHGLSAG